jgi:hypothetical protein
MIGNLMNETENGFRWNENKKPLLVYNRGLK